MTPASTSARTKPDALPAGDLKAAIMWPREILEGVRDGTVKTCGMSFGHAEKLIVCQTAGQVFWRDRTLTLSDRLLAGICGVSQSVVHRVADVLVRGGYLIEGDRDRMGRRTFVVTIPTRIATRKDPNDGNRE